MMILLRFICYALPLLAVVWSHPASAADLPQAISARLFGDETATRLFVDFSKPLATETFYTDKPNRIIIELEEAVFPDDVVASMKSSGLVTSVQAGRIEQGRSRMVIALEKPARIVRASLQQVLDEDYHRLQIDLEKVAEDEFAELVRTQKFALGDRETDAGSNVDQPATTQQPPGSSGRFTVVIDPGHGGIDGGATGQLGTREKTVVLEFGNVLAELLNQSGKYNVKMTRTEDNFISLRERLDFNRSTNADLFVSVHADSLGRHRSVRGSTIYYLSEKASDEIAQALADAENRVDLLAGLSVETPDSAVSDILVDLTTRETKHLSKQFSRVLVANLGKEVKLNKNPIRSAAFAVLKAPNVPSVLLELGYLSNREDEKLLLTQAWQFRAASAVVNSIDEFFSQRQP